MTHNIKEHVCPIAPSKSLITYSIHVNTYIAQFKFSFYLKNYLKFHMCVCFLSLPPELWSPLLLHERLL